MVAGLDGDGRQTGVVVDIHVQSGLCSRGAIGNDKCRVGKCDGASCAVRFCLGEDGGTSQRE